MPSTLLDGNLLIATLSESDKSKLRPHMSRVDLRSRQRLQTPSQAVEDAIFILSGVVSVVAQIGKAKLQVGLIGREGMTGFSGLLGALQAPHVMVMQSKGTGLAIPSVILRRIVDQNESLRNHFNRYAHFIYMQATYNAFANVHAKLPVRLARWILMVHSRLDDDIISVTHEQVAASLAVRRAGISEALQEFALSGHIRIGRGHFEVADRDGLRVLAASFYGPTEREYERLIGKSIGILRTKAYQVDPTKEGRSALETTALK